MNDRIDAAQCTVDSVEVADISDKKLDVIGKIIRATTTGAMDLWSEIVKNPYPVSAT
jgi:hypothetical protein